MDNLTSPNAKLLFLTGDYKLAKEHFGKDDLRVVGQTTETEQEMIAAGFNYAVTLPSAPETEVLFSNNSHFYNGLRLAIKDGIIDVTAIEFRMFIAGEKEWSTPLLSENAKLKSARNGFFDGFENAIMELI